MIGYLRVFDHVGFLFVSKDLRYGHGRHRLDLVGPHWRLAVRVILVESTFAFVLGDSRSRLATD